MALTWTLKLNDAFSGPIKKAGASAKSFASDAKTAASSAGAVDKALAQIARQRRLDALIPGTVGKSKMMAPIKAPALTGVARLRVSLAALGPMVDSARGAAERFGPGIKSAAGALGSFAAAAGLAVAASAALVGGLAIKGIGIVRDAQAFRESTLFAFEKLTGSKAAAQGAMDLAGRTAVGLGADYRESVSSMNSLMAQGFSTEHADRLIKRMADLKTINPMARSEGIVRAITQIKTTGRLQGDELMQLAEAGLSVSDAYDEMAKALGIVGTKGETANQKLQKMQAAGKITADVAIAGIEAAIAKKTGGGAAGDVAGQRANASIEGAIAKAKALGQMQLGAVKTDWSPAVKAVERFQAALASPAGTKFMDAVGKSITRIVALADKFTAKDMSDGLDAATGAVTAMADGVVGAVNAVFKLKASFDGAFGSGASVGALGAVFNALVSPLNILTAVVNNLAGAFAAVNGAASSAAGAARSVGVGSGSAGLGGAAIGMGGGVVGLGIEALMGRAGGGPVNAGQGYMVGERGPEYFQPTQNGSIVPNGELARVSRAGENIGRAVTNSNSSTSNRTFVANVNATAGAEDMGAAIADQLRHLVAGYS